MTDKERVSIVSSVLAATLDDEPLWSRLVIAGQIVEALDNHAADLAALAGEPGGAWDSLSPEPSDTGDAS